MYNLEKDCAEPESTYNFLQQYVTDSGEVFVSPSKSSAFAQVFGLTTNEKEMVSFSWGSGSGWEALSAWGLTADGDVWCLCPVVPSRL